MKLSGKNVLDKSYTKRAPILASCNPFHNKASEAKLLPSRCIYQTMKIVVSGQFYDM